MGTINIGKPIYAAICLVLLISVVNCYGAKGKAEEFFEQARKYSTVETADQAITNYSEAIKINPKFVKAYNNRGIAYTWKKEFYLAIADFTKAIELDPKNGKAYHNRAIVYSYLGENDKAKHDIHKAQSLGIAVNADLLKKIESLPSLPEPIFHKPGPASRKDPQKQ